MKRKTIEDALAAFANDRTFQKEGDMIWVTAYTIYSYSTPIVYSAPSLAEDGNNPKLGIVYFNATKYTKTTTIIQNIIVAWLRHNCSELRIIIDEPRANGSWNLPHGKLSETLYPKLQEQANAQ